MPRSYDQAPPAWADDLDSAEWAVIFADPRFADLIRELDRLRIEHERAEQDEAAA